MNISNHLSILICIILLACFNLSIASDNLQNNKKTETHLATIQPIVDNSIENGVKNALYHDDRVDESSIIVITRNGIVTLKGSVNNIAGKRYAALEAMKIRGVRGVVNMLDVIVGNFADYEIQNNIQQRIDRNSLIHADNINVSSKNGVVTLRGDVDSWSKKREVELLANEVQGVKETINKITYHFNEIRSDSEIKTDVEAALKRDVYLSGLPIEIEINNGKIILTGVVANEYEKLLAERDIQLIPNVRLVDNQLRIESILGFEVREQYKYVSDDELKRAVEDELIQDIRLSPFNIKVSVKHGDVTLEGAVNNYDLKKIIQEDLDNVIGVVWITNNVIVRTNDKSSSSIKKDIESLIDSDSVLSGHFIEIDVDDGIVHVFGKVDTTYQKAHAEKIIGKVEGVRGLVNEIKIQKTTNFNDEKIANDIRDRLEWNWLTWNAYEKIKVNVENGVVTLTGDVNRWAERKEVARIAFQTKGVLKVDNKITVKNYDYPWDEWHQKGPPYKSELDENPFYDYYYYPW